MNSFDQLNLPPALLQAVDALGYAQMTEIQAASLPLMLAGQDVLAQAKTGSGKTAAFGLALLAGLQADQTRVQSLVLCPTRELADQVSKELRALARGLPNIKILSLCGGISIRPQLASLVHAPHVVVGTPGRIIDLLNRDALQLGRIDSLVLDEADRMLDMGFVEAIEKILRKTPKTRKTWLFSATYPDEIRGLSRNYQREPAAVTISAQHDASVIEQQFIKVEPADKNAAVVSLLLHHQPESCLIFCNTKIDARELSEALCGSQIPALALQGDLEQRERDETLLQFGNGSIRVLVATDVAARGLDIKSLPMVIAYELPHDGEVHVHRIGRTGRAGESGRAICLVAQREMRRVAAVEAVTGRLLSWQSLPRVSGGRSLPPPTMATLIIDAGRKDKLRPGDILGALTGDGGLTATQVGKIDLFATRAYVAIERSMLNPTWKKLREAGIKGRRIRVRKL